MGDNNVRMGFVGFENETYDADASYIDLENRSLRPDGESFDLIFSELNTQEETNKNTLDEQFIEEEQTVYKDMRYERESVIEEVSNEDNSVENVEFNDYANERQEETFDEQEEVFEAEEAEEDYPEESENFRRLDEEAFVEQEEAFGEQTETFDEQEEADEAEEVVEDYPEEPENYGRLDDDAFNERLSEAAFETEKVDEIYPEEPENFDKYVNADSDKEDNLDNQTEEQRKERIRRKYMVLDDGNTSVAKIMVIGVGGGGNNAVNRMIEAGVNTAQFVAVNTDKQALLLSRCAPENRYQIGSVETKGLGAGSDPTIGEKAALESKELIEEIIDGVDLLFIAAGMGGGTGTGAAPVIAKIAKEKGCVTVAVVTKPFMFEGKRRAQNAEKGIANLEKHVDTMIIIPNDKLMEAMRPDTPFVEALRFADDTLRQGICGIADLIATPSLINLDFADVRTILKDQGLAHMGIGAARGENRIVESVKGAVSSPLLETTIEGARSIILNVTGGKDLTLMQVNEAARYIRDIVDSEANVIFGMNINPELQEEVIITLIATGFNKGNETAEEYARAYNDLFSEKPAEPEVEEVIEEQVEEPEQKPYQGGWAPDRGFNGGAEGYAPRKNAPYQDVYTPSYQGGGNQYPRYPEPEYDRNEPANNRPEPQDEKASGLPGFVKKLFGGKKK